MTRYMHGLGVSAGEVVGPVARLAPPPSLPPIPTGTAAPDPAAETARAADALAAVAQELTDRANTLTGAAHDVLFAQAMIAGDPVLHDGVTTLIATGLDAPHAVDEAFGEHRRALEAAGGYLAERAADLDDLRDRAIAILLGLPMPGIPDPGTPFVLVAVDLAPADTATLDPETVLAIVTERGGPTGHTAILAKQLAIPAVTACADAYALTDAQIVLVDGANGEVVADPGAELIADAERRRREQIERRSRSRGPGRTADGQSIPLLVNLGGPGDLTAAGLDDCEGVGLLRTEFLFLDRPTAPTFEEQLASLGAVFDAFAGRRVVVRTLDVGADKPLAYLPQPEEPNPALGVRGLRLGQQNPELLDDQLRAIAQAAAGSSAQVWVMAPMVATAEEARTFAQAARAHGLERVGVMVEVPSAALTARQILEHVDFASIGTNDLAQYTLAADRLAGELAELLDPWQPALLRLIAETAGAGAACKRPIGVCGEAASDPMLALVLTGLGITSLSMAPACLPDVRAALAERTLEQCRELATAALAAPSAVTARAAVAELARVQSAGRLVGA
ncbi:MAG TPA: phosphoenolpyruvate--protein phosphotransferase [Solirubrobacteraceae bacterium]|nr:phosphoenolpyruvate--protein phosphotransferase [Solirubrobacteraceae bacterium]